ncbi:hypothetical protein AYO39_03285 [Actinobacteria bacterium SCGC AG-212-D09]|nr:hypothetical protein AYO39_03285 [Actinobacteria bacterium SCGC AG-212-D09]
MPDYEGRDSSSDRRRSLLGRLRRRREDVAPAEVFDEVEEDDSARRSAPPARQASRIREPRHVHAIPSSAEHKVSVAIDAFNSSEHPRTLAGIARSLGLPIVSVRPVPGRPSLVEIVAAWELTWYRYEIDLADGERAAVRVASQGDELSELDGAQLQENVVCDERGLLALDD